MKKMLVAAAVLLVTVGAVFAGEATLGVKGSLSISSNKWTNGAVNDGVNAIIKTLETVGGVNFRPKAVLGGGGELFFRYDFISKQFNNTFGFSVGVQPELGFHFGWGVKEQVAANGVTMIMDFTYNTLDIPVLLTVGLNIGKFKVNIAAGPNFGFALGNPKLKTEMTGLGSQTKGVEVTPFLMGMQVGLGLGFNFTKHHGIIFDARGIFDFTDLKTNYPTNFYILQIFDGQPITRRTGVLLSLGYAYTF